MDKARQAYREVTLHLFWSRAGAVARFRLRKLPLRLSGGAEVTAAVFPRALPRTCLAQVSCLS